MISLFKAVQTLIRDLLWFICADLSIRGAKAISRLPKARNQRAKDIIDARVVYH